MNTPSADHDASAQLAPFEDVVAAFEAGWRHGRPPRIADYADAPRHVFQELCLIDLEMRWLSARDGRRIDFGPLGPQPTIDKYLRLFPHMAEPPWLLTALAEEFRVRSLWGDRPSTSEFLLRHGEMSTLRRSLRRVTREIEDDAAPDARAPLSYGDYALHRLLGRGGMGKVYLATDRKLGGRVAVKALAKSRRASPLAVEQFLHEAEALARLRHPHIVGLHGIGRFPSGAYFIVMDYVEGSDLQRRIEQGALVEREALSLWHPIAAAIDHAHSQGVLHGDLKPANVIVSREGRPVVVDFGLSRFLPRGDGEAGLRQFGGTREYGSPELFSPTGAAISAALDVYGLAALLYALVLGHPPREGNDLESTTLSPRVIAMLRKGLTRDPRSRFANVGQLLAALSS